ncbi:unnamed protein product [Caenorhabditis sp. 36 PRJEB53466]|nr:unnamed protein product [Caenorhabditis sp. 36 PRJEB53466]
MDQPVGDSADGSLGSVGRFHSTYGKKESADGPRQHGADDVEESDDVEGSSEGDPPVNPPPNSRPGTLTLESRRIIVRIGMDQPVGDSADGSLGSVGRFHSTYGKKESADGPRQHGADDVEESDDVEGSSEGEEASRNLPLLMQAVTVAFSKCDPPVNPPPNSRPGTLTLESRRIIVRIGMDQPVGDGADGSLGSVGRFHSTYGKKESADGPRQHGADDVEESDDVEGSSEGEEASRNLPLLMQAVTVAFRSVTRLSTLLQTAALELSRWRAGESLSELEWINLSETAQMAVSEVSGGSTPLMERKNPLTDRVNMELTMLKNLTTLKDLRKAKRPQETSRS